MTEIPGFFKTKPKNHFVQNVGFLSSVCCRSPIVPVRPTYSAELLTASLNGSLPRSAGGTGSAPDLSSNGGTPVNGNDPRSSPVTEVWSNYYNNNESCSSTATTTPTPPTPLGSAHRRNRSSSSSRRGRFGFAPPSPSFSVKAAAAAAAAVSLVACTARSFFSEQIFTHLEVDVHGFPTREF